MVRAAQQLPAHARRERPHGQALEAPGQVSEHKAEAPKKGDGQPRWGTTPRGCSSAEPDERPEKAAGDVGDGYSAKCRRVFGRAHEFNIHSVSTNCDGETLVSADDVRINLWHAEVTRQCFNIVDMKPADMEDLVGDFVVFLLLVLSYP